MASSSSTNSIPATSTNTFKITPTGVQIFHKAVRYILTEWPSLNIAIDNGQGGREAQQKRSFICDHITEILINGKDVELDDYLADMIDQEFDTIIEDGSLEYNVKWINKFYKDCLQGKEADVDVAISQAALKKQSLGNVQIPPPINATEDTSSEDDSDS